MVSLFLKIMTINFLLFFKIYCVASWSVVDIGAKMLAAAGLDSVRRGQELYVLDTASS